MSKLSPWMLQVILEEVQTVTVMQDNADDVRSVVHHDETLVASLSPSDMAPGKLIHLLYVYVNVYVQLVLLVLQESQLAHRATEDRYHHPSPDTPVVQDRLLIEKRQDTSDTDSRLPP